MSGMTGLRRCRRCLREALEDSEAEEAQLDREEVELAGVRFDRDVRPPGTLGRWARSDGLGGQTGLCLLRWWEPRPGRKGEKTRHSAGRENKGFTQKKKNYTAVLTGWRNGRSCNHVI